MNFTAHSSNRVSKVLIMDYLTWLLLRHKEPRVLQVDKSDLTHASVNTYYLFMLFYFHCVHKHLVDRNVHTSSVLAVVWYCFGSPWLADGGEATGIPLQETGGHDGGRVCRDNGQFGAPHSRSPVPQALHAESGTHTPYRRDNCRHSAGQETGLYPKYIAVYSFLDGRLECDYFLSSVQTMQLISLCCRVPLPSLLSLSSLVTRRLLWSSPGK